MTKSKGDEAAGLWKDVRQYVLSAWQTTLSPLRIPYERPYSWEDPRMKLVPPVLHPPILQSRPQQTLMLVPIKLATK